MNLRLAFLKETEDSGKFVNSVIQIPDQHLSGIYLTSNHFPVFSVTSGIAENANRNNFWTSAQVITWQFILMS